MRNCFVETYQALGNIYPNNDSELCCTANGVLCSAKLNSLLIFLQYTQNKSLKRKYVCFRMRALPLILTEGFPGTEVFSGANIYNSNHPHNNTVGEAESQREQRHKS